MTDSRTSAPRLLAGLQAGVLAGLVSLAWFILLSYSYFQEPWALINVLAASLRRNATWSHNFTSVTWTGLSAHLAACGLIGIFLGWVLPRPGSRSRTSITGLIFGVLLSMLIYQFFWLRFAPLLADYISPVAMWVAHLLVGLSLAQFPRFYLQLADPEPAPVTELPSPDPLPEAPPAEPEPPQEPPPSEPPPPSNDTAQNPG